MGITMGDALSVVSAFLALGVSLWATTMLAALLAPHKARVAQERLASAPYRTGFVGLVSGFLWAGLGIVLLTQPVPVVKLAGLVVLGTLACTLAVGLAGVSQLLAEAVGRRDPSLAAYTTLARGAGLVVAAAILPLVGWFFLGPIVLLVSVGAGFRALVERQRESTEATVPPELGGL